jgi:1,4-alpha-glucan branching enzyme
VGDFNSWDRRLHPLRSLGASGIWEIFVPDVPEGSYYKFEVVIEDGRLVLKSDPYAFATEPPPATAARVFTSDYEFSDDDWMQRRGEADPYREPMAIYEVHLGSWRRGPNGENLTYREMAPLLTDYCREMGFTHVEFLPVAEHPFYGSWGYQVSHYFAPTARYGTPDEFRFLVDTLHQAGIGVIVDWVPAHFPKDEWALARFDGTALYEHLDPRLGEHPDWGTLVFNFGRNEVRNFLISNALHWLENFHIDGLRVDAVASMLYLDYSRKAGEWVPNRYGGNENLEAIEFLKELNTVIHGEHPGVVMLAEESTAWPGVSRPVHVGGLGFGFKWNMGWMHDTLMYFSKDPIHRRYHHNNLTFSLMYAWSENFVLPLSHDEVVHGKGSLLNKMPGDRWQQMANLRCLLAYMWAHPGKQLLFMGAEIAQEREWTHEGSLDWHLLDHDQHRGMQRLVQDLNRAYQAIPALWELDQAPEGFSWIDANDADNNVISFFRTNAARDRHLICVCNLSPTPHEGFRIGLPKPGTYEEVLNTDADIYAGGNVGNLGGINSEEVPWHGFDFSAPLTLPPLATVWLYG